ncbi:MAG: hypothetical protein AB7V46_04275, partial [Thermomicrobiales bacterium]
MRVNDAGRAIAALILSSHTCEGCRIAVGAAGALGLIGNAKASGAAGAALAAGRSLLRDAEAARTAGEALAAIGCVGAAGRILRCAGLGASGTNAALWLLRRTVVDTGAVDPVIIHHTGVAGFTVTLVGHTDDGVRMTVGAARALGLVGHANTRSGAGAAPLAIRAVIGHAVAVLSTGEALGAIGGVGAAGRIRRCAGLDAGVIHAALRELKRTVVPAGAVER